MWKMVDKKELPSVYSDLPSRYIFSLKPYYQMVADVVLQLPCSYHALGEYYPVS